MARPSGVSVCSTLLRSRWLTSSPALRSTVVCWLAAAAEMLQLAGHLAGGAALVAGLQHRRPGAAQQRRQRLAGRHPDAVAALAGGRSSPPSRSTG